jgi:hypothetical protein
MGTDRSIIAVKQTIRREKNGSIDEILKKKKSLFLFFRDHNCNFFVSNQNKFFSYLFHQHRNRRKFSKCDDPQKKKKKKKIDFR